MKYNAPFDATDPDAPYIDEDNADNVLGSVPPGSAIEYPQREIVGLISACGLTPTNTRLTQGAEAIQTGRLNYVVAAGTANALTVALPIAPLAYYDGMPVRFKAVANSTNAVTLNVNGLGAKSIAPPPKLMTGKIYIVYYNSTADAFVFGENALALKNMTVIKSESSGYAIANSVITTLPLTSFSDDGQADFTVSGNTIVCARAGRYAVLGNFGGNSNPSLMYAVTMGLRRNGAEAFSASNVLGSQVIYQLYGGGADVIDIATSDVFNLWAYQVSGGTTTLTLVNRVAFQRLTN